MNKIIKITLTTALIPLIPSTYAVKIPGMNIEGELCLQDYDAEVSGDLHVYGSITGTHTLDFTNAPDSKVYLHSGKGITDASDEIKTAIQSYHDENFTDQTLGKIYMWGIYSGTIDNGITIKKGDISSTCAILETTPNENLLVNVDDGEDLSKVFEAEASDVFYLNKEEVEIKNSESETKTISCRLANILINDLGSVNNLYFIGNINLAGSAEYLTGEIDGVSFGDMGDSSSQSDISITSPIALPDKELRVYNGSLTLSGGDYKITKDLALGTSSASLEVAEGSSLTIAKGGKLLIGD